MSASVEGVLKVRLRPVPPECPVALRQQNAPKTSIIIIYLPTIKKMYMILGELFSFLSNLSR